MRGLAGVGTVRPTLLASAARVSTDPDVPKTTIRINGRSRIPDELDAVTMGLAEEVNDLNSIGKTKQLQDMVNYAAQNGYTIESSGRHSSRDFRAA